ncbi:MAG: tRNA uridine-5-carboxymethylaminomethyl(34) synthesis GTPase MnmE [Oscillospiraceae bacterium]|jgi:tRNA modification GTPase|nr:tRNA uridine-5-carboxymethylaminomethyl(34) synthesis GTPase MnmE [Oscillospiraceae bacterium]
MLFVNYDTIAAISTPPGIGGVGIVRISGTKAWEIADQLFIPLHSSAAPQTAYPDCRVGHFYANHDMLDECVCLRFCGPKSYTGEDVAEFQCHGGRTVLQLCLKAVLNAGARLAEPGEFIARRFTNGKIRLDEAESIARLLTAQTEQEVQLTSALLDGSLHRKFLDIREQILNMAAETAFTVDYPEEDGAVFDFRSFIKPLQELRRECDILLMTTQANAARLDGLTVAIIGSPNVGKSTLLNALLGYDRAIVTEIPGTTRDTVQEMVVIDGIKLLLQDTAGIRAPADEAERIGIDRARAAMENAQIVLLVLDSTKPLSSTDLELLQSCKPAKTLLLLNKHDDPHEELSPSSLPDRFKCVEISALHRQGIDKIVPAIQQLTQTSPAPPNDPILCSARQEALIEEIHGALSLAIEVISLPIPLIDIFQQELEQVLQATFDLTGENTQIKVMEAVFARFCVGK